MSALGKGRGGTIWRRLAVIGLAVFLPPLLARAAAPDGRIPKDPDQKGSAADVQRGYWLLTNKAFVGPDIDPEVFAALWQCWEEPLRSQAEKATPAERRKMTLSRYGLMEAPERTGRDKDNEPPLQYVDNGQGGWAVNCFSCHGGKVAGKVIPGLPNTHIALETFAEDVKATKERLGKTTGYADVGLGDIPLGGSNGTSNAVVYGVVLGAKRDLKLNYVPTGPVPSLVHHDHDAPPWWNVKRKARLYSDNFAPKTHRALMPFMMVPDNGPKQFAEYEADFRAILAWIESLEAPKYPYSVDESLAAAGRTVFNRSCATCHGTYGAGGEYPELIVPIEEVGTDPLRLKALSKLHRWGHQVSWFGHYGKSKTVVNPGGYLAPPLDGVWASAPYLHNGAVPTLWHLMNPEKRPVVWTRTEDGYDTERVGLEVTELDEVPASATTGAKKRQYFDSRIAGKSREGHLFPNELTDVEKRQVIEYLKTL